MKNYKKGQVLLITVMLMATIVSVVMTAVFKANVDTQVTKLQEESNTALSAAEAGLEKALKVGAKNFGVAGLGLTNLTGIDLANSAVTETGTESTTLTPQLQKDEQYTFYLANYDSNTFGSSYTGTVILYYLDSSNIVSCDGIALEATLIYGNMSYSVKRYVADTGRKLRDNDLNSIGESIGAGSIKKGKTFWCKATFDTSLTADSKLLIIRPLYKSTRLALEFQNASNAIKQGKTLVSEAKTYTGVTKKIELFQSDPQIPTEFFVTSF